MKYELYKKEKQKLRQWAADGFGASVIENIEEEAEFEATPGYDRTLLITTGDVILACEGESVSRLQSLEQTSFTGGKKTKCFGKFEGYCLAVKKEDQGLIDVIELKTTKTVNEMSVLDEYEKASQGFYCMEGYGVITMEDESVMLKEGEQIFIYGTKKEQNQIGVMGEGKLIRTQIFSTRKKDAEPKPSELSVSWNPEIEEPGPKQKATFSDFVQTVKISATNFRLAKYIFKFAKNNWYDQELRMAMEKIRRKYIAILIWLFGILIILGVGSSIFTAVHVLIAAASWSLAEIFIIMPLIYLKVVPKPVKDHIKPVSELTKQEEEIRQEQLGFVPRASRVLKRYK